MAICIFTKYEHEIFATVWNSLLMSGNHQKLSILILKMKKIKQTGDKRNAGRFFTN